MLEQVKETAAVTLDCTQTIETVDFLREFLTAAKFAKDNGLWEEVKHQSAETMVMCYRWRKAGTTVRGSSTSGTQV